MRLLTFIWALSCGLLLFGQSKDQEIKHKRFAIDPVLQFAGGIGQFSLGPGYSYHKEKLNTQLLVGYVSKKTAGRTLWILTLKQTYFPFKINDQHTGLAIFPISIGVSTSFYNIKSENAEELPYLLNSTMYNYFIGGKLEFPLRSGNNQAVGLYYELGSNYIETHTLLLNRETLGISDILNLGIGIYYSFR